mmetsp:Transcript_70015/g.130897  ORF Transcript_70015/g.130897 Transcript_70015/m.130897 type:complete len:231 (+) Transcript_70015:80-772(+)
MAESATETALKDAIPPHLQTPQLPGASPLGDVACPLGPVGATPALLHAESGVGQLPGDTAQMLGGLGQLDQWAWEMSSEAGSVPSAWSKPSTTAQSGASSLRSRMVGVDGDGLIGGLTEGQRLSYVKPSTLPSKRGGRVIVGLRKQVPQGYWDRIEVVLVSGPHQVQLKPTGIKKGKKLCVEVPAGLEPADYDVRISFSQKLLNGAIALEIREGDEGLDEAVIEEEEEDD